MLNFLFDTRSKILELFVLAGYLVIKFLISGEKEQDTASHTLEDVRHTTPTETIVQNLSQICIFHVHSLRDKFSDLEALAASDDFHIIGVSESWINIDYRNFLPEYNLPNYSMFSCELHDKKKSRIVFIYVKASLNSIILQTEEIDNVDVTFLRLKKHIKNIVIGLIYRPPARNITSDEKLYDQIIEVRN